MTTACRRIPRAKKKSNKLILTAKTSSPVNLGIFEAQHQTNCLRIVFNAI